MSLLQTLEPVILTVHFLVCIFLIVVVLVQAGKGADIGAAFGAGSSQTLFGARGAATFLSKVTTVVAILFLVTSVSLASIHRNRSKTNVTNSAVTEEISGTKEEKKPEETSAPVKENTENSTDNQPAEEEEPADE